MQTYSSSPFINSDRKVLTSDRRSSASKRKRDDKVSIVTYSIPQSSLHHIKHKLLMSNDTTLLRFSKISSAGESHAKTKQKQKGVRDKEQQRNCATETQSNNKTPLQTPKEEGKQHEKAKVQRKPMFQDAFKQSSVIPFIVPSLSNLKPKETKTEGLKPVKITLADSILVTGPVSPLPPPKQQKKIQPIVTFQDCDLGLQEQSEVIRQLPVPINRNQTTLIADSKNSCSERSKASSKKGRGIVVTDVFKKYETKLLERRREKDFGSQVVPQPDKVEESAPRTKRNPIFPVEPEPSPIHLKPHNRNQESPQNNSGLPSIIQQIQSVIPGKTDDENIDLIINNINNEETKTFRKTLFDRQLAFIDRNIKAAEKNMKVKQADAQKYVPSLPMGKLLTLRVYDNWGHPELVGFNGIEIFDDQGEILCPVNIAFDPGQDLQGESKLASKYYQLLEDNSNFVAKNSDTHVNSISMDLGCYTKIAMLRFWNYSGPAPNAGVKTLEVILDGAIIFVGEIKQNLRKQPKDRWRDCEYIVLTEQQSTIDKIRDRDWLNKVQLNQLVQRGLQSKVQSSLTLHVGETYGDTQHYGLTRIKLYDIQNQEIDFNMYLKSRSGLAPVSTLKQIDLKQQLFLVTLPPFRRIAKISIRNAGNQSSIKKALLSVCSQANAIKMFNLDFKLQKNQSQYFHIAHSAKYVKSILNPKLVGCAYGRVLTISVLKSWCVQLNKATINKLQIFDVNGVPLLTSRCIPCSISIPIDSKLYKSSGLLSHIQGCNLVQMIRQSQSGKSEQYFEISVVFEQYVHFGCLCIWNPIDSQRNEGVKQVKVSVDSAVVFTGFVSKGSIKNAYSSIPLLVNSNIDAKQGLSRREQMVDDQNSFERIVQLVDQSKLKQKGTNF